MTHHQALQDIPDTSKVSLHKNNKFNSTKWCWKWCRCTRSHFLYSLNMYRIYHN
jgi:hypothetical protein